MTIAAVRRRQAREARTGINTSFPEWAGMSLCDNILALAGVDHKCLSGARFKVPRPGSAGYFTIGIRVSSAVPGKVPYSGVSLQIFWPGEKSASA
jgi:hypothetical protein